MRLQPLYEFIKQFNNIPNKIITLYQIREKDNHRHYVQVWQGFQKDCLREGTCPYKRNPVAAYQNLLDIKTKKFNIIVTNIY